MNLCPAAIKPVFCNRLLYFFVPSLHESNLTTSVSECVVQWFLSNLVTQRNHGFGTGTYNIVQQLRYQGIVECACLICVTKISLAQLVTHFLINGNGQFVRQFGMTVMQVRGI